MMVSRAVPASSQDNKVSNRGAFAIYRGLRAHYPTGPSSSCLLFLIRENASVLFQGVLGPSGCEFT